MAGCTKPISSQPNLPSYAIAAHLWTQTQLLVNDWLIDLREPPSASLTQKAWGQNLHSTLVCYH